MKTRALVMIVAALTVMLSAQVANTSAPEYSAHLISPTPGQVLRPGQKIKVEWTSVLPKVRYIESCEAEVRLSLDGGATYLYRISPYMDAKTHSFDWTVPNLPTNAAVMDIRFGCEPLYPESAAPQPASMFVIANGPGLN
jgi:hypothetical protein